MSKTSATIRITPHAGLDGASLGVLGFRAPRQATDAWTYTAPSEGTLAAQVRSLVKLLRRPEVRSLPREDKDLFVGVFGLTHNGDASLRGSDWRALAAAKISAIVFDLYPPEDAASSIRSRQTLLVASFHTSRSHDEPLPVRLRAFQVRPIDERRSRTVVHTEPEFIHRDAVALIEALSHSGFTDIALEVVFASTTGQGGFCLEEGAVAALAQAEATLSVKLLSWAQRSYF